MQGRHASPVADIYNARGLVTGPVGEMNPGPWPMKPCWVKKNLRTSQSVSPHPTPHCSRGTPPQPLRFRTPLAHVNLRSRPLQQPQERIWFHPLRTLPRQQVQDRRPRQRARSQALVRPSEVVCHSPHGRPLVHACEESQDSAVFGLDHTLQSERSGCPWQTVDRTPFAMCNNFFRLGGCGDPAEPPGPESGGAAAAWAPEAATSWAPEAAPQPAP